MSIGRVMLAPTPTAAPLIAAITGLVLAYRSQCDLAAGVPVPGARLPVVERAATRADVRARAEGPARRRS